MSQYSGAAPVSLKSYSEAVRMQAAEVEISRDLLRTAFSDMVVPDGLLDQIGPALIEQSSIFLYGPPGNGKSSLAERLLRVYEDSVLIPYAIEVDGQVISVYDPAVHQRGRRAHVGITRATVRRFVWSVLGAAADEGQQRDFRNR